jgi:non-ribosomal peptide synthase protein (TIGR01720 family)
VEALAQQFLEALRDIIRHCQSAQPGYTPSDFPQARLDQKSLDKLLTRLRRPVVTT